MLLGRQTRTRGQSTKEDTVGLSSCHQHKASRFFGTICLCLAGASFEKAQIGKVCFIKTEWPCLGQEKDQLVSYVELFVKQNENASRFHACRIFLYMSDCIYSMSQFTDID